MDSSTSRASVIGKLIEIISNSVGSEQNLNRIASNIDVKIEFNDLKRNRWVAELYKEDALLVDESIKTLDAILFKFCSLPTELEIISINLPITLALNILGWLFICTGPVLLLKLTPEPIINPDYQYSQDHYYLENIENALLD